MYLYLLYASVRVFVCPCILVNNSVYHFFTDRFISSKLLSHECLHNVCTFELAKYEKFSRKKIIKLYYHKQYENHKLDLFFSSLTTCPFIIPNSRYSILHNCCKYLYNLYTTQYAATTNLMYASDYNDVLLYYYFYYVYVCLCLYIYACFFLIFWLLPLPSVREWLTSAFMRFIHFSCTMYMQYKK